MAKLCDRSYEFATKDAARLLQFLCSPVPTKSFCLSPQKRTSRINIVDGHFECRLRVTLKSADDVGEILCFFIATINRREQMK